MENNFYGVFSFSSPHHAIASDKISSQMKGARLIPVPPEISAGCGLALRVYEKDIETTIAYLNEKNIPFKEINKLEIKGKERIISDYNAV